MNYVKCIHMAIRFIGSKQPFFPFQSLLNPKNLSCYYLLPKFTLNSQFNVYRHYCTRFKNIQQSAVLGITDISETIKSAPRLQSKDLEECIDQFGINTVINLQSENEVNYIDDSIVCNEMGIEYIHSPINYKYWNKESVDIILRLIHNSPSPKLIICASNIRASACGFLSEIKDKRMSQEVAYLNAKAIAPHAVKLMELYLH